MKNNKGFTLVEIIVAVTVFSLMMTSVIMIFSEVSQVNRVVEVNRQMQENLKKSIEYIAEDIRKNVEGGDIESDNAITNDMQKIIEIDNVDKELIIKDNGINSSNNKYYLASKDNNGGITARDNNYCSKKDIRDICYLVVEDIYNDKHLLTNSGIHIEKLKFYINNVDNNMQRVTVILSAIAPLGSLRTPEAIENSRINFQTTLGKRLIPNTK